MRLIFLLSLGLLFTQELQVDGNLNVTGTIESATIDSLNQVILELQNQIAGIQVENRLETRVFTTENYYLEYHGQFLPIDIQSLIGTEIDNAFISLLAIDMDGEDDVSIIIADLIINTNEIHVVRHNEQFNPYTINNSGIITYTKEVYNSYGNYIFIWRDSLEAINVTLTLAITAQFPN
jgi:hypothetical protein